VPEGGLIPKSLYITSSDEDVDKERNDEALLGPDAIYHTAYAVRDFPHEVTVSCFNDADESCYQVFTALLYSFINHLLSHVRRGTNGVLVSFQHPVCKSITSASLWLPLGCRHMYFVGNACSDKAVIGQSQGLGKALHSSEEEATCNRNYQQALNWS